MDDEIDSIYVAIDIHHVCKYRSMLSIQFKGSLRLGWGFHVRIESKPIGYSRARVTGFCRVDAPYRLVHQGL